MTTLSINNPVLPEGPWQSLLSHADTLTFKPSFEHAFTVASQFLRGL
jgi:hypothetical protein